MRDWFSTLALSQSHCPAAIFPQLHFGFSVVAYTHAHRQYNEQDEEEERGSHFLAVAFAGGFFATGTFDDAGGGEGGGTWGGEVDGKSRHGQEIRLSGEKEWIRQEKLMKDGI